MELHTTETTFVMSLCWVLVRVITSRNMCKCGCCCEVPMSQLKWKPTYETLESGGYYFGHYNFYLPRKLLNLVNTFDKIFPYIQPPCISDLTWWDMTAHSCNIAATPCIHHWVPPPSLPVGSPNPSLDRRCNVQGPNSLHTPKKNILNIRVRTVALKGLKTPWLC